MVQETTREVHGISLLDSLDGEWLKLPLAIMQDTGPAVQTMGGLLKLTIRETYASVGTIAGSARLPAATVKKHLTTLDQNGWIVNEGRQQTRRGFLRRTATLKITKQTADAMNPYGILPWWACCSIRRVGRLPWCCKAMLSVVLARLCSLKAAAERDGPDDDVIGQIDNMGGADRFRLSLDCLTSQTGLTRHSVITAKRLLQRRFGIVQVFGDDPRPGQNTGTDLITPNWEFRVVVTPASEGRCFLDFDRGCKSGR